MDLVGTVDAINYRGVVIDKLNIVLKYERLAFTQNRVGKSRSES